MLSHLLSKLPTSRPADWGCKVTVCIGALCEKRSVVVAATDMLPTLGNIAADVAVIKNDVLFPRWAVLTAGDDVEHLEPILDRARVLLTKKWERKSPQEVATKLARAYEERLQEEIRIRVLSRFRFTPNTFRDHGKRKLTASVFNSLASKIASIKIRLKFLVCGLHRGEGHILGFDGDGAPVSYNKLGFWAIGDGAPVALASLGFANHRIPQFVGQMSLAECVYQVCAAKFMAETVRTVGRKTFLVIYGPNDGQVRFIFASDEQKIRDAWENEGAPRQPQTIVQAIPGMLLTGDEPNYQEILATKLKEWEDMVRVRPSIAQR